MGDKFQVHDCCDHTALWIAFAQVIYTFIMGYVGALKRLSTVDRKIIISRMGEEHKQAGIPVPLSGYPDHGSGRYAAVLPYSNWFTWNTAVRVH